MFSFEWESNSIALQFNEAYKLIIGGVFLVNFHSIYLWWHYKIEIIELFASWLLLCF